MGGPELFRRGRQPRQPLSLVNARANRMTATAAIRTSSRKQGWRTQPEELSMQLGMIGLGRMGANMVRRLLRGGHSCVVYDRSQAAVNDLAKEGAVGT